MIGGTAVSERQFTHQLARRISDPENKIPVGAEMWVEIAPPRAEIGNYAFGLGEITKVVCYRTNRRSSRTGNFVGTAAELVELLPDFETDPAPVDFDAWLAAERARLGGEVEARA